LTDAVARPAVFFDRDGVLNRDTGYVHRPEEFEWLDGAKAAIRALNERGYLVFVITNQAGVAYGRYGEEAVKDLHRWIAKDLASVGAHIDGFYYCPHHPEGKEKRYAVVCECRKPKPGLLLAAMRKWDVDRERSFLIGDKESDIQASEAAGVRGILWRGGNLYDGMMQLLSTNEAGHYLKRT
jgi:D-glycero-D-manno-heptose 1,7-bisphosphate phosphatase